MALGIYICMEIPFYRLLGVVSPFPPSDKIGINSVQRESEEIIPMTQMKMDWVPYIPLEERQEECPDLKLDSCVSFDNELLLMCQSSEEILLLKARPSKQGAACSLTGATVLVFVGLNAYQAIVDSQYSCPRTKLDCDFTHLATVMTIDAICKAALKHLKLDRVKKYEYCLPYFYQPFKEDELEQSTEVQIIFPAEPKPIFCEFDWELDELEEFTDKLIQEEELSEDQKDTFKEFVKGKVREAKKANREARESRRKAIAEMSEETKAAFETMRFYKFYPMQSPDAPDVSNVKSPFINRYYGKAHEVLRIVNRDLVIFDDQGATTCCLVSSVAA
ncbi:hypothetical protein V8G54_007947 [Vigna mungo]|uniref:Uncharacterized protein n=1 Tax=Vigna mungo TaxID=3915 RepID=A0AAQ3P2U4_VIGMU